MPDDFATVVEKLIRKAPTGWLAMACETLKSFPADTAAEQILRQIPATHNADLSFLVAEVVRLASGLMSWEVLGWAVGITSAAHIRWQNQQHVELLWPVEKRGRNQAGRPGKLHAKLAIVDDTAIVSSANLTDDAFNRNLEVGVLVKNPEFLKTTQRYIDSMVSTGTLKPLRLES